MRVLVRDGILVDPILSLQRRGNLLVRDGRVEGVTDASPPADEVVDAGGAFVCPGFVDMHAHLREPGSERKETVESGLRAALAGGFTAVAAMPNTSPTCDSVDVYRHVLGLARAADLACVYPVGAVTVGLRGRELAPMAALAAAGCRAFSNDGRPVLDSDVLLSAMRAARRAGVLLVSHCEDPSLAAGGVMHDCPRAARWGLPGIPAAAEDVHVARDLLLAEDAGCRVHIAHVSTARAVELVRWARGRGVSASAEACPHHFCLSVDDMPCPHPDFKMSPPLRGAADRDALVEALRCGAIDVIATDHAPHSEEEKALGFSAAPFGVIGLETAVPLAMDRLVKSGLMGVGDLVMRMAVAPARLLGIPARTLAPGAEANLTVLDFSAHTAVDRERMASRSKNTPFHGWTLHGGIRAVLVKGRVRFLAPS